MLIEPLLLAQAERRPGIVDRLAGVIPDDRDPSRVRHRVCDILRARAMAVACGYEDADDLDALRHDPGFMMAPGKAPGEEVGLVSQPTMSRFENRANVRSLIHIGRERVDPGLFMTALIWALMRWLSGVFHGLGMGHRLRGLWRLRLICRVMVSGFIGRSSRGLRRLRVAGLSSQQSVQDGDEQGFVWTG